MRVDDQPSDCIEGPGVPERRLMSAILWEAFHSLQRNAGSRYLRGESPLDELLDWFGSDQADYVFSFRSICSYLEIDPARIRHQVGALTTTNA